MKQTLILFPERTIAKSQSSEHAVAKSLNSILFKKTSFVCCPGRSWGREQAQGAAGDRVLMVEHQAFDAAGITASPKRTFYSFCSPITVTST